VAEVEHVALARAAVALGVAVQHARGLAGHRVRVAVQGGRVEVALQRDLAAGAACRIGQVHQPVHAHAIGAGGGQVFQVGRVALAEQDQRGAVIALATLKLARDPLQVAQRELAIQGG